MGPQFKSSKFAQFLQRNGVHHRQSSCYFPHWNWWSEVAVKPGKRMIRDNIGLDGQLTDKFVRALGMYQNTPIPYISEKCMRAGRYAREVSTSLSTCCNLFTSGSWATHEILRYEMTVKIIRVISAVVTWHFHRDFHIVQAHDFSMQSFDQKYKLFVWNELFWCSWRFHRGFHMNYPHELFMALLTLKYLLLKKSLNWDHDKFIEIFTYYRIVIMSCNCSN